MVILLAFAVLLPILPAIKVSAYGDPLTGNVTITGNAFTNNTLTADISDIVSQDGIDPSSVSYVWRYTTLEELGTGSTYTITPSDVGKQIIVQITCTSGMDERSTVSGATYTIAMNQIDGGQTDPVNLQTRAGVDDTITYDMSGSSFYGVSLYGNPATALTNQDTGTRTYSAVEGTDSNNIISSVSVSGSTVTINTNATSSIGQTATVTVTMSSPNYQDATQTINVVATGLLSQTIAFTETEDKEVSYGDADFTNTASGGAGSGTITYSSSQPNIASVDEYGTVTINGIHRIPGTLGGDYIDGQTWTSYGIATITATKAADATYAEATTSYDVYVYTRYFEVRAEDVTIYAGDPLPDFAYKIYFYEYETVNDPPSPYTLTESSTLYGTDEWVDEPVFTVDIPNTNTPGTYNIYLYEHERPTACNYTAWEAEPENDGVLTIRQRPAAPSSSDPKPPAPSTPSYSSSYSSSYSPPPAPKPAPEPIDYDFPPCINKDITISPDGKEVTSKTGVKAMVIETANGVFVKAGVNPTGSVNTHSTAAAACLGARIVKEKGYKFLTVNVPSGAKGLSKTAVQKIICGAQDTPVTLSFALTLDGEEIGTMALPITRDSGQILTSVTTDTTRTSQIGNYIESRWNIDALGGFETAQRGGWGAIATITLDIEKLGIESFSDELLYAVVYDTAEKRWYESPVTVKNGMAVFKTSRTGIVSFTAYSVN